MIPWQLKFSGIRDYGPTLMNFGEKDDHVMISGPNGSGKSTITFCIGAVLYSSKVELDGLKSRNLLQDETWRSSISIIFKNDGELKIDAPLYIEFKLNIIQEPAQPIKREYIVSSGDGLDSLEHTATYKSGDSFTNFTQYKKDLQYKYKIDPDLFYLIWYQQEVNQFAVMSPEERFRVFSEMHGIEEAQRNWEASLEQVKEAKESLKSAEMNLKFEQMEMDRMKTALDRYIDNKRRLEENGTVYIQSLINLEDLYKKEVIKQEDLVKQLTEDIENQTEQKHEQLLQKEQKEQLLAELQADEKIKDKQIEDEEQQLEEIKEAIHGINKEIEKYEKELEHIESQRNKLTMPEQETRQLLFVTNQKFEETSTELANDRKQEGELLVAWEGLIDNRAELSQQINQDVADEKKHVDLLENYKSSHKMNETIKILENARRNNMDKLTDLSSEQKSLQTELQMLENNNYVSIRQQESLRFFRENRMTAFPLRELIQLNETATIKDEQKFEAIKYTLFFVGGDISPPNDLYHVSLRLIVPDRSITSLPSLHIKIRPELPDEKATYAMKALWWIEQFFKNKEINPENGVLRDHKGLRGNQEKEGWILSEKALQMRRSKVGDRLKRLLEIEHGLKREMKRDMEEYQLLINEIQKVREAEAFMTNRGERLLRIERLETTKQNIYQNEEKRQEVARKIKALFEQEVKQDTAIKNLEDMLEIYEQLGELKPKYEYLEKTRIKVKTKKADEKGTSERIEVLDNNLSSLQRKIKTVTRKIEAIVYDIENIDHICSQMKKQKENAEIEIDQAKNERVTILKTLTDLKNTVPKLYEEILSLKITVESSIQRLKNIHEDAKIKFDYARNEAGIDPAAEENYEAALKNYEKQKTDYDETSNLLEQDIDRMEILENRLETAIDMGVRRLQQLFQSYMGHFQFEGEIAWERFEDKRQRIIFKLFIKARKEGHRGTLEDVSVKARGGKVGKGVSGGEESLSSLLFALALLQNIQATPGFIILDEFDSALDEQRKAKVFELYASELRRKLIILSPKSHESAYYDKFTKAFIVSHDPTKPISKIIAIRKV